MKRWFDGYHLVEESMWGLKVFNGKRKVLIGVVRKKENRGFYGF